MAFRPALDLLHHPCVAVGIGEFDHRAPITIVEDVDITGGNAFFGELGATNVVLRNATYLTAVLPAGNKSLFLPI